MTYEPLELRHTHDLLRLGLSEQTTRNTTSHAETQATKAKGRRGAEAVMMASGLRVAHAVRHNEHEYRRPSD